MQWFSLFIGFVVGTLTGAAGYYFGQKYTDQRREKEAIKKEKRLFDDLCRRFPNLLAEMKQDVRDPSMEHVREFFVSRTGRIINAKGPHFIYYTDQQPELSPAIARMEELGYIEDITPGNAPKYRMTEEFVDLLKR